MRFPLIALGELKREAEHFVEGLAGVNRGEIEPFKVGADKGAGTIAFVGEERVFLAKRGADLGLYIEENVAGFILAGLEGLGDSVTRFRETGDAIGFTKDGIDENFIMGEMMRLGGGASGSPLGDLRIEVVESGGDIFFDERFAPGGLTAGAEEANAELFIHM
jgi:hypothetical protein